MKELNVFKSLHSIWDKKTFFRDHGEGHPQNYWVKKPIKNNLEYITKCVNCGDAQDLIINTVLFNNSHIFRY